MLNRTPPRITFFLAACLSTSMTLAESHTTREVNMMAYLSEQATISMGKRQFTTPKDQAALYMYLSLLKLDPSNPQAEKDLGTIYAFYKKKGAAVSLKAKMDCAQLGIAYIEDYKKTGNPGSYDPIMECLKRKP
jgi:hypothetical protein